MSTADAIVVGAGPAGLSAAIALRMAGAGVVVLEQLRSPQPRVCGAFVSPEGAVCLDALGVRPRIGAESAPVGEARLTWLEKGEARVAVSRGGKAGIAVPRPVLERAMAERLADLGGTVRWGARVTGAAPRAGGWTVEVSRGSARERLDSRWLVVADGRFSTLSGRPLAKTRAGWFGWNASFAGVDQPPGALSLHFGRRGYVGVLTFADGTTNVCGLVRQDLADRWSWEEVVASALDEQPALARLLRRAVRRSAFHGVGPLPFAPKPWPADGRILAGDAAAVGDPYLGEGISRALGTGPALTAALGRGGPGDGANGLAARYGAAWRRRYRPRLKLGAGTRWLLLHPRAGSAALDLVASHPRLLAFVLSRAHGVSCRP